MASQVIPAVDIKSGRSMRAVATAAIVLSALLAMAIAGVQRADAAMEIKEFTTSASTSQAGGHPDVDYSVVWTTRADTSLPCNCEDARVLDMHFPTGFIGNPHNIPECSLAEFATATCPIESQVGVLEVRNYRNAIYNMEPHPGEPGLVAFTVPIVKSPGFVVLHARTGGDYGLDATSSAIYHLIPFNALTVHLWGVPADPSHDANRFPPEKTEGQECAPYPGGCFAPVASHAAPTPYLQNPTTCGASLMAAMDVQYYEGTVAHAESPWPATTGCDQLSFNPSLAAEPTTTATDTASGLDIDLKVPQPESATAPSPSEIRSVKLTLPQGFSFVPNGANGKTSCDDAELFFSTEEEARCPEFAKIGTVSVDSSALPGPIPGNAYIGKPLPGNTFRLFVTADGYATHVKLKGTIGLDHRTGQIVASFNELPQSPFQEFKLHFFGSERGIFGTPNRCGSYPVETEFTPWDNVLPSQTSTSFFTVDSGPGGGPCPGATRPFSPRAVAGSRDNTAGIFSPFTVQLERNDGDQNLTGVTLTAPTGILASLRGVPYCPESAIAHLANPFYKGVEELTSSACPAASRVGSVTAGVGPGTRPLYVGGTVYLAGPYRGAPVSFVVVIPAVSGPYDLGNVAVRVAAHVDPVTGQVTTVSDQLPLILEGIPLRTRFIQIRLDRPNFVINPTNCDPFSTSMVLGGDEGASASLHDPFQVANCTDLGYGPKASLKLTGGLRRLGHPAIHAVLTTGAHEANSDRVVLTLPRGELLDNTHIKTICTMVDFAQGTCPAGSMIGHARVTTPLLDQPLEGGVYLRASSHKLPDLVMDLKGQVDFELSARVDSVEGRLRTSFENIPDAPVSSVVVDLAGGSRGLLQNSESLCGTRKSVLAQMTGQNGVETTTRPRLQFACGSSRRKRHLRSGKGA